MPISRIEYRGNSTPPERNMIAQRGVGISRGRLFKCRRLSSALCVPRLDETRMTPHFYRLFRPDFGDLQHKVLDRPRGRPVIASMALHTTEIAINQHADAAVQPGVALG